MKHLKTLSSTFIPPAFCALVEVGNRREVNTSAYLSHWFQGSCYGLSLQISSLLCLQPTSNNLTTPHTPPLPTLLMPGQIYFNSLLTDVVGFEAGKSGTAFFILLLSSSSLFLMAAERPIASCISFLRFRGASQPFSVCLMLSWHGPGNRVGQDRSGPLSPR